MDNSTNGLNILSIAVQEHSKNNSRSESNNKTQACCNIKSETGQKNERQTISHRQIEKRRRDRINNTLWMLKDLVPAAKRKFTSGSGRLEKADLLEMTIQHIKDVHRNLTTFEEKERKRPCGNANILNESYNTGFKDGMLQILDIMKKTNLLTQAQTELLLKESIMAQDSSKQSELVKCNKLSGATKTSQPDLVVGSIELSSLNSDCEMARQDLDTNPVNNINIEDITTCIKAEDLPSVSADSCNNFESNGKTTPRLFHENTENLDSAKSFPFHDGTFHKQTSLHVNNGTQNPILLPVYALHASGTHYVPVFLPPSSILPTDPG